MKRLFHTLFITLLFTFAVNCSYANSEPLVITDIGAIEGVSEHGVEHFYGIPYAKAPVHDLRFAPTVASDPFADTFKADSFCPVVPQSSFIVKRKGFRTGDNSLCLNIYRPKNAKKGDKLPVFVWIHGGAYMMGASNNPYYDGTAFAKDGVILVSINYRLHALGFYSSKYTYKKYGTTGNWGHLDMIEALKWVRNHIESFGGDPDKVTIGGESAGSMAVSSLVLSPLAKGLFKRAVLESGTILSYPFVSLYKSENSKSAFTNSAAIATLFGADDSESGLEALRTIDPLLLSYNCGYDFDMVKNTFSFFKPYFDGVVLPQDPYKELQQKKKVEVSNPKDNIEILIGYNTDEGSLFTDNLNVLELKATIKNTFGESKVQSIAALYLKDKEPTDSAFKEASSYNADIMFNLGMKIFADAMSKNHKVYMYHFDYAPFEYKKSHKGVSHSSEIAYVFSTLPEGAQKDMKKVSDNMHQRFVNFIKTGDPNFNGKSMTPIRWPLYNERSPKVYKIDKLPYVENFKLKDRLDKLEELLYSDYDNE